MILRGLYMIHFDKRFYTCAPIEKATDFEKSFLWDGSR